MGRNPIKNEEIRSIKKVEIEEKALLYFAKYGYYGTKMNDLSKGIGISSGLIYHYYASKEELLSCIISKIMENRDKELEPLQNAKLSAEGKIKMLTNTMRELIMESDRLAATFTLMENMNLISEDKEKFNQWAHPSIDILSKIIQQGQQEGSCYLGNGIEMSVSYWGLISAICRDKLCLGKNIQYSFEALNRMLLKGEKE